MPHYVVRRTIDALNQRGKSIRGAKVLVLGLAYKKDIDDPRESPSFELMEMLEQGGALLSYNDPHVPKLPSMRHHKVPDLTSQPLTPDFLAAQDCVLIATDHSAYDYGFIVQHAQLVVDTRNATRNVRDGREKIVKA
jgi:UDP-N-acetyl-D-glucosamine dehydrogenase